MRILILNQYFPPDASATAKIVCELAGALAVGHTVTVLAGRPSYNPDQRHAYYLFRRDHQRNVIVERVGSTSFHRRRMAGRVANFLSYLGLGFIRAVTMRPRPDVVIAMTDPPLICLVAALVAKWRGCSFIYNIRDLHPDMALASGVVQPGFLTGIWECLHRWVLKQADLVIVLGDDMRARILSKGISPDRVVVVRDGADPLPTPEVEGHPTVGLIRGKYPFVVVHAGNLGFAGDWDTLLDAARLLENENVGFVFVGEGSQRPHLERKAKNLKNLRFLPFRPPEEIPYVMASADLQIVTVREGLEGLVVPSKLYPVLMAGKPVLGVAPANSDIARIINDQGCGLIAAPQQPQAVANVILWARDHPDELLTMGRKAQKAAALFDRQSLIKEFVSAIERVVDHQEKTKN